MKKRKTISVVILFILSAALLIGTDCQQRVISSADGQISPAEPATMSAAAIGTPKPSSTTPPTSPGGVMDEPTPSEPTLKFPILPEEPGSNAEQILQDEIGQIHDFLEEQTAAGEFSGAVLIASDGEPVLLAGYGLANRDLDQPNHIETKFNLGSMDKMFTAVAVMQLLEQDKLSLDEVVGTYLPDYPDTEIAQQVTIHQLLTHTSGLGNYFDNPLYDEINGDIRSLDDYLELFVDTPLMFQPGERFSYSNSGYIVLGLITEAISGQSYYDYVRDHIFAPAGMQDTASVELDASAPDLAVGYTALNEYGDDTGEMNTNTDILPMRGGSAGGGYSTAPDLLAFGNALLDSRILGPETTELMLEGKVELGENVLYGYGYLDRIVQGYRVVGHGGGFPGICSLLGIYPELEYTVVILSNSDYGCMVANDYIQGVILKEE